MFTNLKKGKEGGFSLVELLVVVVIIGILAAIAIPIYTNQKNKGYAATSATDVTNIATELTSVLSGYTNMGTSPTISFSTPSGGTTTATITPGVGGLPSTTAVTATFRVSPTVTAAPTGTLAGGAVSTDVTFCLSVVANGQTSVATNTGYQSGKTTCGANGVAS